MDPTPGRIHRTRHARKRTVLRIAALGCLTIVFALQPIVANPQNIGEQPGASVLVPTNQTVTPAGIVKQIEDDRPKDLALSPDANVLAVLTRRQVRFFRPDGTA